eukprot:scaffold1875_cov339-Prasinococcus_capsulatus_cf.AAC.7
MTDERAGAAATRPSLSCHSLFRPSIKRTTNQSSQKTATLADPPTARRTGRRSFACTKPQAGPKGTPARQTPTEYWYQ